MKFKTADSDHQINFEFLFFLGLSLWNPKNAHKVRFKLIVSGTIDGYEDVISLTN